MRNAVHNLSLLLILAVHNGETVAAQGLTSLCSSDPASIHELRGTDPLLRDFFDAVCPGFAVEQSKLPGVTKDLTTRSSNAQTNTENENRFVGDVNSGTDGSVIPEQTEAKPSTDFKPKEEAASSKVQVDNSENLKTEVNSMQQVRSMFEVPVERVVVPVPSVILETKRSGEVKSEVRRSEFLSSQVKTAVQSKSPAVVPVQSVIPSTKTEITRSSFLAK